MVFGLVIRFTQLLRLVPTSNYNAVTNSRTQLLTTARAKPSQFVFTVSVNKPNSGMIKYKIFIVSSTQQFFKRYTNECLHKSHKS
jgi:hypothetical protein